MKRTAENLATGVIQGFEQPVDIFGRAFESPKVKETIKDIQSKTLDQVKAVHGLNKQTKIGYGVELLDSAGMGVNSLGERVKSIGSGLGYLGLFATGVKERNLAVDLRAYSKPTATYSGFGDWFIGNAKNSIGNLLGFHGLDDEKNFKSGVVGLLNVPFQVALDFSKTFIDYEKKSTTFRPQYLVNTITNIPFNITDWAANSFASSGDSIKQATLSILTSASHSFAKNKKEKVKQTKSKHRSKKKQKEAVNPLAQLQNPTT